MKEDAPYPVYGANGIIGHYDKYNHTGKQLLLTCRGATCGMVNISYGECWINGNAMVIQPIGKCIDFDFAKYYFIYNGRSEYLISGTAQPQITRQSLDQMSVILPPLAEQQRIVQKIEDLFAVLDNIQKSIEA